MGLFKCSLVCCVVLLLRGSVISADYYLKHHHHKCDKIVHYGGSDFDCKPRPQVVPIPRESHEMFEPNSIEVPRCSGGCSSMNYCSPDKDAIKKICVTVKDSNTQNLRRKEVEWHEKCTCCSRTCKDNQNLNQTMCSCECKDKKKKEHCWKADAIWDEYNCVCERCKKQLCGSSEVWSKEECKCIAQDYPAYGDPEKLDYSI